MVLAPTGALDLPALRDDDLDERGGAAMRALRLPGGNVSVVVRCIRQFHEGAESITLAKVLVLPDVPTMGARLDLRAEGVEAALTVVGVTLTPIVDGPGLKPPTVEVALFWEPLAAVEDARAGGWR